jgi:hypothetical protein
VSFISLDNTIRYVQASFLIYYNIIVEIEENNFEWWNLLRVYWKIKKDKHFKKQK